MKTCRFYLCLLIVAMMTFVMIPAAAFAADVAEFTITDSSRIYIATDTEAAADEDGLEDLMADARTLCAQFAAAGVPSDEPMPIFMGKKKRAKAGDIVLITDGKAGSQGYSIKPADGKLEVHGSLDGVWYGTTDVLQDLIADGLTIKGRSKDRPDAAERALLLDCGRKYYSRTWIENLIKRMSWQRYTSLHLHFSDSQSMRFESRLYPWLNADKYLTFDDLESICATARQYHIEIIPELDSPGHLDYVVSKYAAHVAEDPDFSFEYDGRKYSSKDEGFSNISNYYVYGGVKSGYSYKGIDLANETARAFMWSLIDEYADFFAKQGSTKFCIGGDELFGWDGASVAGRSFGPDTLWTALEHWEKYAREELGIKNGSAADTFITYLNDLSEHLGAMGYSCRVWNDEIHRASDQHVELNKDINIIYWTNNYTPMKKLAENGNMIHSSNTDWIYYVIREDRHGGDIMDRTRRNCNTENIYENWEPRNCAGPKQKFSLIPEENMAGGYFCIWSDMPDYKSAATVWEDTEYRSWAVAARLWEYEASEWMAYRTFKDRVKAFHGFPGYSGDCEKDSLLAEVPEIQEDLGPLDRLVRWFKGLFN